MFHSLGSRILLPAVACIYANTSKSGAHNCSTGTPLAAIPRLFATLHWNFHPCRPALQSDASLIQAMDTVGLTSASRCASCGSDASTHCSGCVGAPDYESGDAANTAYCNRDCQKAHWSVHKARCKILQQRKTLLRAAQILKAALLTYREATYDIDLTGVHYEGGVLWLHQNRRLASTRAKRGPFPNHLVANSQHKEAALAHNSCTTAMALLSQLTRTLLQSEWITNNQDVSGLKKNRNSLTHRGIRRSNRKAATLNPTCPGPRFEHLPAYNLESTASLF